MNNSETQATFDTKNRATLTKTKHNAFNKNMRSIDPTKQIRVDSGILEG